MIVESAGHLAVTLENHSSFKFDKPKQIYGGAPTGQYRSQVTGHHIFHFHCVFSVTPPKAVVQSLKAVGGLSQKLEAGTESVKLSLCSVQEAARQNSELQSPSLP